MRGSAHACLHVPGLPGVVCGDASLPSGTKSKVHQQRKPGMEHPFFTARLRKRGQEQPRCNPPAERQLFRSLVLLGG